MAKILVVEDELIAALSIEEIIRDLGHEVLGPVARLSAVMRLLDPICFDAALLDVRLRHGAVVFPAADILIAKNVPFAFMTAYGRSGIAAKYADRAVLTKPFSRSDVARAIEDLTQIRPGAAVAEGTEAPLSR